MLFPRLALSGAFLLLALSGCASQGSFPSLAPRPVERELGEAGIEPPPPVLADDPALPARLEALVAAGRHQSEFETELAAAKSAVARAGKPGSDSWTEAQQAVSRAEAARSSTNDALADLDAFAVEQANAHPLSPGDAERIRLAMDQLQQIAGAQEQAVASLKARLGS